MKSRSKRGDPIDRAISDLDHQIATVQRQLRELTNEPARATGAGPSAANAHQAVVSPAEKVTRFVKGILSPSEDTIAAANRARQDLFDVVAEPLKELEAEPIAFAHKPEPDLFAAATASATSATPTRSTTALESAQVVRPGEKLIHYLGAGSIKSYKPLKRAQRQLRNRFFMWLGLSFVALWIIWFVIR
jgi:nitrous oxide reductase